MITHKGTKIMHKDNINTDYEYSRFGLQLVLLVEDKIYLLLPTFTKNLSHTPIITIHYIMVMNDDTICMNDER